MSYTRLGDPPRALGHTVELPVLFVEDAPGSGGLERREYELQSIDVAWGSNDRIPRATLKIGLGAPPDQTQLGATLRDWQLYDLEGNARDPQILFGGRRRVQVRTARPLPMDDWIVFDGYVDAIGYGWSGNRPRDTRWLVLHCTGAIAAADREHGQHLLGQYRRTRDAEALRLAGDTSPESDATVCCTGLPVTFNPGGAGNCDTRPITLDDGTLVHVFADPKHKDSGHWNMARMLRYVQWCAVQPGPTPPGASWEREPYLASLNGSLRGFNAATWTSLLLWHSRRQPYQTLAYGGPNLSELVEPHLAAAEPASTGTPRAMALRSQPATVTVQGMSVLESLALLADTCGMMMEARCDPDYNGRALHYVRFSVRGDWIDDTGILPDPGGELHGPDTPPQVEHPSSRLVELHVASDGAAWPDAIDEEAAALRSSAHGEGGMLTLDEARLRTHAVRIGQPCEYEVTAGHVITAWPPGQASRSLLPGWEVDAWWDVNPADEQAVNQALARIDGEEWRRNYGDLARSLTRHHVGRLWVLNEDGRFRGPFYQRSFGPFSGAGLWRPYGWATQTQVMDLVLAPPGGAARGNAGWSARRRRFLPTIAVLREGSNLGDDTAHLPPLVEISFDAGETFRAAERCGATVVIDEERCAVRFGNANLTEIEDPEDRVTLPEAYIRGLLRVKVTANIESDDAAWGWAREMPVPPGGPAWTSVACGRGRRRLRVRPTGSAPAANSQYVSNPDYFAHVRGVNQSDQAVLVAIANQVRDESLSPVWSGPVSMPWWQRDSNQAPLRGYRVGDEVRALRTRDATTHIDMGAGRALFGAATRLARISAVALHYSAPATLSTTLELEHDRTPVDGRATWEGAS